MSKIFDVIEVRPLEDFKLHLTFENGVSGTVDVKRLTRFSGVFQPLLDPAYFQTVQVDPNLGTVCWESGADLDPLVLYAIVSGHSISPSADKV